MAHIPLHDRPAEYDGEFNADRLATERRLELEQAATLAESVHANRDNAAVEQRIRAHVLAMTQDIAKSVGMAAGDVAELLAVLDAYTRSGPTALPKARPRKIAP